MTAAEKSKAEPEPRAGGLQAEQSVRSKSADKLGGGKPECEACHRAFDETLHPFGHDWEKNKEGCLIEEHHALLADKDRQLAELQEKLRELANAVVYTSELYPSKLTYQTSKGIKPNFSIGFETRYRAMDSLARSALESSRTEGP